MLWRNFFISILILAAPPARAQAFASMQGLANALEFCAIDTGYYVSLETLNDLTFQTTNPTWDWLYLNGGPFVLRPTRGSFEGGRVALPSNPNHPTPWRGPYINFQTGQTQLGLSPYDQGSPLDPWGQPYLFFSPLGLLRGDTGSVTQEYYGDAFDRYTLVSLGPDMIRSGDDIFYAFGGGITAFALSSVGASTAGEPQLARRLAALPRGAAITLRGANLGAAPAGAQVFFGSREITPSITAWRFTGGASNKVEIDLTLPTDLYGSTELVVQRASLRTNGIPLEVQAPNAVHNWLIYP